MPSFSELDAKYNAFHEKEFQYLADLNREPRIDGRKSAQKGGPKDGLRRV